MKRVDKDRYATINSCIHSLIFCRTNTGYTHKGHAPNARELANMDDVLQDCIQALSALRDDLYPENS